MASSLTCIASFKSFLFPIKTKGYLSPSGGFKLSKNSLRHTSILSNEVVLVKSNTNTHVSEFL